MESPAPSLQTRRLPSLAKYEIVDELGHGGMATVYRAHDKILARDVAIKLIHPHLRDSLEIAHRFFNEAKAVAKLRHPNIVEVFDVSREDEREQYLVVELVRGVTLRKLLQTHGLLPPEVTVAIALELLNALFHAHEAGVIHRDVKPENVMIEHVPIIVPTEIDESPNSVEAAVGTPGDRVRVKLTDFGIAKLLDAQGITSTGQVLGSPAHMAPEQIEGGEVDERADVFGLGVLMYEAMVGHLPFEGRNPAQVLRRVLEGSYPSADRERPTIGRSWSQLIDRALAHDPRNRFPHASAMRDAFRAEFDRVGARPPREELERWYDDPAAYQIEHSKHMISTLCARARVSSKQGNAVAAAGDYNRALAYAPSDPVLLKLVARMHRAEIQVGLLKSAARVLAAAFVLGSFAFVTTRWMRSRMPESLSVSSPEDDLRAMSALSSNSPNVPPASGASSSESSNFTGPDVKFPPASGAAPVPPPAAIARPPSKPRNVVISSLRPLYGVTVAIDGLAPVVASVGQSIPVDNQSHTLDFQCAEDLCSPQRKVVPAGEGGANLSITMVIKPAVLVIDGNPQLTYRITEEPTLNVRPRVPVRVPMKSARYSIHVVELPSNRTLKAVLMAGGEMRLAFD